MNESLKYLAILVEQYFPSMTDFPVMILLISSCVMSKGQDSQQLDMLVSLVTSESVLLPHDPERPIL